MKKEMHLISFYLTAQIIFTLLLRCTSKQANILIFGGNGFIGSECTSALLAEGHNITLVSRGSSIYDFETRIKPHVHHIKCDRYKGLQNCPELLVNSNTYDVLLDFSAYYPDVIQDALMNLRKNFKTYIYISTDSVYEVSVPSENAFSKESDAIRYEDEEQQNQANERDSYGHHKLQGEEVLVDENRNSGLQYIIFRLPDVIGPRDTTVRWWVYQTWFEYYGKYGHSMSLPRSMENVTTSYVYVKDIGKVISRVIGEIADGRTDFLNQAYNLGFPEPIALRKLLHSMQEALGIQGIEYNYIEKPYYLYPSVSRGPLDITRAKTVLNWEATSWSQAIKEIVSFYQEAICLFPKEREDMLDTFRYHIPIEDFPEIKRKIQKRLKECTSRKEEKHTEL